MGISSVQDSFLGRGELKKNSRGECMHFSLFLTIRKKWAGTAPPSPSSAIWEGRPWSLSSLEKGSRVPGCRGRAVHCREGSSGGRHYFHLKAKVKKLHWTFQFWFAQLWKKTELDLWVVNCHWWVNKKEPNLVESFVIFFFPVHLIWKSVRCNK